jgi:phospho-N-acetylmuramoyl-pentapeptide-transferase
MLYHLSLVLKPYLSGINVLHYISVRALGALLTSLGLSLLLGGHFITIARRKFASQPRENTPASHQSKQNLPTMGGIFILGNILVSMLVWGNLTSARLWLCLLALIGFGLIGLLDDWNKLKRRRGISSRMKFGLQLAVSAAVALLWIWGMAPSTELFFPFFKNLHPDLGYLFVAWVVFVLVASSNAVNLTDGLDGLALGSLISNFGVFAIISYLAGHVKLAAYLQIPFAGTGELVVLSGALLGSSLGFLWYNSYPAQIFMGDVGSLALGGVLGLIALMTKQELLFIIAGGLFVLETVSVIIQVLVYRIWKRRVFKMAPIHHHFELLGWPESKITVRFAIISVVLGLLALITLKLR